MSDSSVLGITLPEAGKISYGRWEAFHHPTGNAEFLPVIIARGRYAGPCFWLTAGIHGPEHGGPVVIYRLLGAQGALNQGQGLAMSTLLLIVCALAFVAIERFRIGGVGEF